jgi:hypothetical protein
MQELLELTDVGPAFQESGGQAGGNIWRNLSIQRRGRSFNRTGVSTAQNAELIFSVRNPLPNGGQSSCGVFKCSLCAGRFNGRGGSAA